jgi:hypothetical protein
MRSIGSAREHEPVLDEAEVVELLGENAGPARRSVEIAIGYWAAYPAEVDAEIAAADAAEVAAEEA